ncbi:MAG: hypothetical protein ABSG67_02615 [Thermoguttaceae bacterium]|jgi:hypothetical protein
MTELQERLLDYVRELDLPNLTWEELVKKLADTDWSQNYSWQGCIPKNLQSIWSQFSIETRIVSYIFAKEVSDQAACWDDR